MPTQCYRRAAGPSTHTTGWLNQGHLRPLAPCRCRQTARTLQQSAVVAQASSSFRTGKPLPSPTLQPAAFGWSARCNPHGRSKRACRLDQLRSQSASSTLIPLGMDFLTFLTATVFVVPVCKQLKVSPVLGFLASGVILEQLHMLKDLRDVEALSELGVLFLLFEQGLELSLDRLKALAKYAFGMGSLQVVVTTLLFTAFALPVGHSFGTLFLEVVCKAPPSLVSIRTVDEAVVIGAALAMSSSAFVLQLLQERGELPTRVGSATLGILLFQDIAVVPFLVLLPVIEMNGGMEGASPATLLQMLGPTALQTVAGLGALLLGGRFVLRRIFEMVAESRSSETFVALCLLTVGGTSLLTKQLGLSDTLGAFIAGVLLSETSFRTQVEADIRPFRGLLIGLFFLSVGSSINMEVLRDNYDIIGWMLLGLVSLKAGVNICLGPLFGLSKAESIRTGFMLSQGGEFAFVLLSLACQLKLLPNDLNQILIIMVVCSMALTPALAQLGQTLGDFVETRALSSSDGEEEGQPGAAVALPQNPVVIVGFGPQGQMLANMVASPLARSGGKGPLSYLAFDLDPARLTAARAAGFNIVYGDGSRPDVLHAAGVKQPLALVVCHESPEMATHAVKALSEAYKSVPLYAVARDFEHAGQLRAAGAINVCISGSEAGINLGSEVLSELGTSEGDVALLRKGIHEAMAARSVAAAEQKARERMQQQQRKQEEQQLGGAATDKPQWAKSITGALSKSSNGLASGNSSGSLSRSSSASSTSSSGVSGFKHTICKKPGVEVFILDGRMTYGTGVSEAVAHADAAAAAATEVVHEMVNMHDTPSSSSSSSNKSSLLGIAVEDDMCGVWNPDGCDPALASSRTNASAISAAGHDQGQVAASVPAVTPVAASVGGSGALNGATPSEGVEAVATAAGTGSDDLE